MATKIEFCRLMGRDVMIIANARGDVKDIACPQFDVMTRVCELKRDAQDSGRLSLILLATGEDPANGMQCGVSR